LNNTLSQRGKTSNSTGWRVSSRTPAKPALPVSKRHWGSAMPSGARATWSATNPLLLLPDMIMQAKQSCMHAMVELYNKTGGNIIGVQECDPEEAHKYGIVGVGRKAGTGFRSPRWWRSRRHAPSNPYINGRYILQPEIFDILSTQERGAGDEIQLTDGMLRLKSEQQFYGYHFEGNTFDCGSPDGFCRGQCGLCAGP
jgi:UTP--glucose-1-phosphate uridylyltransferase